jgi:DNA-directed RNA polymerase subunit K
LRYTKYEKARIIGARALQIAMGAPVMIDTPEGMADPIDIALLEFDKKVTPLTVIREKRQRVSFPKVT